MLPESPLLYQIKNRLTHEDHLDDYDDEIEQITNDVWNGTRGDAGYQKIILRRSAGYAFEVR
jgi:hypothetical protein